MPTTSHNSGTNGKHRKTRWLHLCRNRYLLIAGKGKDGKVASWKCPKCCTENNVKYLQCSCGYEFAEVYWQILNKRKCVGCGKQISLPRKYCVLCEKHTTATVQILNKLQGNSRENQKHSKAPQRLSYNALTEKLAEVSELAKKINPVVAGHLRNAVMIILESKDKVPNWNMYSLAKRSVLFKNLSKSVLSVIAAILNGENPQNIADKYVSERKEAHTHNSRARRSSAPVEDYMLEDNYDEESFP